MDQRLRTRLKAAFAGEGSRFPARSIATTANRCLPGFTRSRSGDLHGSKPPPSSLHSKLDPRSLDLNANRAARLPERFRGCLVIVVSGGVVSQPFSVGGVELLRGAGGASAKSAAESFVSSPGSSCVAQPGAIERCSVFAPTPNGIAGAGLPVGSGEVRLREAAERHAVERHRQRAQVADSPVGGDRQVGGREVGLDRPVDCFVADR